ncbi:phenylacetic acid degradation protein PaaN [Aliiglaciecola sp. 2_MG-2023]|uniref:phenylacetic acid degradation protein PaaN n=1 Tax=unclassified Aliiglaciecola TaxID=2593648 RepID=UPI0026E1CBCF|nr:MULTISPECIES: phenylacetic acid degradation protein PaaN [unclassified Aliiglaciecola]MDO6711585.1 phenylacetic acid degradation protein PaaN [Aliiglaciecola sp. 2_MG-2023]MDO6752656.1 phenylacetic acid degradation protein PaaN [Aliiglaciecola sp. 1_MG-2023]
MSEQQKTIDIVAKHKITLEQAIDAVKSRKNWSPFKDSPSTKIHGPEKPVLGKAAFEAHLNQPFKLDLPGIKAWAGAEVSPFTQAALGITYPLCDPEINIAAAKKSMPGWAKATPDLRIALCLEMAERLYDRNFEMAHSVMHVAGQSYTQAFSGSGPNALDRGIEALAYASIAMDNVVPKAQYQRTFGREQVNLEKTYTLVPRGVGLVICCASFPTWNAYPAMFASLATGNPVVVKPHPIAILPMAIVVETCRATLAEFGFDPNLVTLAADTIAEPIAKQYIDHPDVQIIDFTGSPRFGSYLENTVTRKLLYTETAGVNSVVVESVDNLAESMRAIARATSLFSAQMCTSPQVVYVPKDGIKTANGQVSFEQVAQTIVNEIDAIAEDPKVAAGIMGAIQGQVSLDVVEAATAMANQKGLAILRQATAYPHPDFPNARTRTPLVISAKSEHKQMYSEERFGPVLFIVATQSADAAAAEATELAKTRGTISCYMYSTNEDYIDRWVDEYAQAGANLTINLTGAMWINFAAAYSDYHVTGLNPAGNACLADLSFVASRFRIAQRRRPISKGVA